MCVGVCVGVYNKTSKINVFNSICVSKNTKF